MHEGLSRCIKVYQGATGNEGLLQLEHVQAMHRHCKKSGPSNLGFKVSQARGMPTGFPLSTLAIEGLFSVRSMSVARLGQTHVVDLRRVHGFHGSFLWFQLCLHEKAPEHIDENSRQGHPFFFEAQQVSNEVLLLVVTHPVQGLDGRT